MTNAIDTAARSAFSGWALLLAVLLVLPGLAATGPSAFAEDEEPTEEMPTNPNPNPNPNPEADEEAPAEEPKAELPWVTDISAAKEQAAKEGKDLFINFTGSDWCGWCHRLDEEVFTHAAFVDAATKDFVFLYLDFPRSEEKKAEILDAEANAALRDALLVEGFPTIILATADATPYGRTGYQEGGPEAYLEHLTEKKEGGSAIKKLLADVNHEDAEALKAAFPVLSENSLLGYADFEWTLDAAEKLDPQGELELLPLVERERNRRLAVAEQEDLQKLFPQSPGEEPDRDAIISFLKSSKHLAGPQFLNLVFGLSNWLLEQKRPEDAKALLARAGEDPLATQHPQAIQVIEQMTKRADEMIAGPAEAEDADEGDEHEEGDEDEGHDDDEDEGHDKD